MGNPAHNPARRAFLRGRPGRKSIHVQLPWLATLSFVDDCTRCGECLAACPEKIIVRSTGGFPSIDFAKGECTFCAPVPIRVRSPCSIGVVQSHGNSRP